MFLVNIGVYLFSHDGNQNSFKIKIENVMVLKIMFRIWGTYAMLSDSQRFIICWILRYNISDGIRYVFDDFLSISVT